RDEARETGAAPESELLHEPAGAVVVVGPSDDRQGRRISGTAVVYQPEGAQRDLDALLGKELAHVQQPFGIAVPGCHLETAEIDPPVSHLGFLHRASRLESATPEVLAGKLRVAEVEARSVARIGLCEPAVGDEERDRKAGALYGERSGKAEIPRVPDLDDIRLQPPACPRCESAVHDSTAERVDGGRRCRAFCRREGRVENALDALVARGAADAVPAREDGHVPSALTKPLDDVTATQ